MEKNFPTELTHSPATTACSDLASADPQVLIARAVAACAKARRHAVLSNRDSEQQLRSIREAGRLLSLVQRSRGGRRRKNVSIELTSYAIAVKRAGISRQTALDWRHVAEVSDAEFEQFLVEAKRLGRAPTIADLLRPRASRSKNVNNVRLELSEQTRLIFDHRINMLAAVLRTPTVTATVLAVLDSVYRDWLMSERIRVDRFVPEEPQSEPPMP